MRPQRFISSFLILAIILGLFYAVLPAREAAAILGENPGESLTRTAPTTTQASSDTAAPSSKTQGTTAAPTTGQTTAQTQTGPARPTSRPPEAASSKPAQSSTAKPAESTAAKPSDTTKKPVTTTAKKPAATTARPPVNTKTPLRAVWLSYIEFPKATVSREQYAAEADRIFAELAKSGFNAAFVHVRAFADSIYPSKLFPWAKWLTGKQGKDPGYDPLAILLAASKKHGIAFHAWMNPFRVQTGGTDEAGLAPDNPALKWLRDPEAKAKNLVVKVADGIYFNPAAPEVHKLIYDGVREILQNYNVDGIHIDDYFYPSQKESIDSAQYESYKKSGGKLSLDDWRRASVNTFVAGLYQTVKNCKARAVVSISPGGNIRHNRDTLYADAARWLSTPGYLDMIIPQLYYGFENQAMPFERAAKEWNDLVKLPSVQVAFGLAAYKSGKADQYAGSGKNEWIDNSDILARQAAFSQRLRPGIGLVLFSWDYVLGGKKTPALTAELNKLYKGGVWQ